MVKTKKKVIIIEANLKEGKNNSSEFKISYREKCRLVSHCQPVLETIFQDRFDDDILMIFKLTSGPAA